MKIDVKLRNRIIYILHRSSPCSMLWPRLPSTDSVLCLLKWVEQHMGERRAQVRASSLGLHTPTSSLVHIPDQRS